MPKRDVFGVRHDKADVMALKALKAGNANEAQQQRALEFIVQRVAGEPSTSYADTDRDTCFLEGRRFVGRKIIELVLMDAKDIK